MREKISLGHLFGSSSDIKHNIVSEFLSSHKITVVHTKVTKIISFEVLSELESLYILMFTQHIFRKFQWFEIVFSYQNTVSFYMLINTGYSWGVRRSTLVVPSRDLWRNGILSCREMGTALGHSMVIIKFYLITSYLKSLSKYSWHELGPVWA